MKWLLLCGVVVLLMQEITCPPVQPEIKPIEGDSPDDNGEDPGFGLEYDRYLKEIVMALEEDESFRKKLEEMNMTDIKSGKIAKHLDLVSHQIRERLDEIKRHEMNRLRMLAKEKMKQMNGIQRMDEGYLHHVDVQNPHSFESKDLEKLIRKATYDLDEIDKKRRGEFKTYEMEKEHQRREELKNLDEEKRKAREEEYQRMKKRHEDHPKMHHPGSKDQLEDVWEKTDKMDPTDFDPKTFFKLHDLDGNGFLDQDEVEALFQKELDQVYDPNMPEDDMRERYEDMARMREHVFGELDGDKDRLISMGEFLNYTASQEFQKDEGWQTVDEQQNFTDEEYQRYEQMLREHEERMRAQGLDPNMVQPGMVPLGHDPNVQHMQMPQGGQGMHQQQQQQFQRHDQEQQMRQMAQMQGQMGGGFQGGPPGMGQGHGQGQMGGGFQRGPPAMGQGHGSDYQRGPPAMGQGQMRGGPPGGPQAMGQGAPMPPAGRAQPGQGRMPDHMEMGQGQNIEVVEAHVNQAAVSNQQGEGQGHVQGSEVQGQPLGQNAQGQEPLIQQAEGNIVQVDAGVPVENVGQAQEQHNQNLNIPQGQGSDHNLPPQQGDLNPPGQAPAERQEGDGGRVPPAQGQPPRQPVQGQGQQQQGQPVQGQDTLKFQGQGQQEQNKPLV